MDELEIKRHNFDLAKDRLKQFSEISEAELAIDKVKTDGGFLGLGDHKVTGYELNNRLSAIQSHLIDINTTNNKTIKEFKEVYNTFDALDKDYISSIVANVKALEKTSNDVRQQQQTLEEHHGKLASQQGKLDSHQKEIEKNVDNMKKVVATFKSFKEKLDGYKHLTDIDKIWSDCSSIQKDIRDLSDKTVREVSAFKKESEEHRQNYMVLSDRLGKIINDVEAQIIIINRLQEYIDRLKEIEHIEDVDIIWRNIDEVGTTIDILQNEINGCKEGISQIEKRFTEIQSSVEKNSDDIEFVKSENINQNHILDDLLLKQEEIQGIVRNNEGEIRELQADRKKIYSVEHIFEIDNMWEQGNTLEQGLLKSNDEIVNLQNKVAEIENIYSTKTSEMEEKVVFVSRKLKYAYYVAGGAVGIAVVELILLLIGVI